MRVWPPYRAAGICVRDIAADWSSVRVEMVQRWWNRNYVGTHFGGNLFSMTDPFYMLLYINRLGSDWIVWDYAARIRFVKPGRGTVRAEFRVDEADLEAVREQAAATGKVVLERSVEVLDAEGDVVARIVRELYFRSKADRADQAEA